MPSKSKPLWDHKNETDELRLNIIQSFTFAALTWEVKGVFVFRVK